MEFTIKVSPELKDMDARLFRPELMDLVGDIAGKPRRNIPKRLSQQWEMVSNEPR
jgi:hypothetical protein